MKYEKITKFTKIVLDIMFYSGLVVWITIPVWLKLAGKYYSPSIRDNYVLMLLVFAAAGICGILIVNQLRRMTGTVLNRDCFVMGNVKSLVVMSRLSLCISVIFIIATIFMPTVTSLIIVLVFFIASLFSAVLSCVFREAIHYKEENDLTI